MEQEGANVVAIVDDDEDVGAVLKGLLEAMGYSAVSYKSGPEFLADAPFDRLGCLVIDQNMPQMTGIDLLTRLNEDGIFIPTLLITGQSDAGVRERAVDLGVMTVLEKPMSSQELLSFVAFSLG